MQHLLRRIAASPHRHIACNSKTIKGKTNKSKQTGAFLKKKRVNKKRRKKVDKHQGGCLLTAPALWDH
jgi:hypothetical protein